MVDLGKQHDSHLDLFVIDRSIRMLMMNGHTEAQAVELLERRLKLLEQLSPEESKELLAVIVAGDN
jgi:hypothetical protein